MSPSSNPAGHRRMQILVALDESRASVWALQVAAKLAADVSAEMTLLHVVPGPTGFVSGVVFAVEEIDDELRRRSETMLHRLQQLFVPTTIESRCQVRAGDPAAEILHVAATLHADLIVLGTRGRGAVSQLLLGSTADAVIRRSICPVVTVSHDPQTVPSHWTEQTKSIQSTAATAANPVLAGHVGDAPLPPI